MDIAFLYPDNLYALHELFNVNDIHIKHSQIKNLDISKLSLYAL
jgi:hypothetical protein